MGRVPTRHWLICLRSTPSSRASAMVDNLARADSDLSSLGVTLFAFPGCLRAQKHGASLAAG